MSSSQTSASVAEGRALVTVNATFTERGHHGVQTPQELQPFLMEWMKTFATWLSHGKKRSLLEIEVTMHIQRWKNVRTLPDGVLVRFMRLQNNCLVIHCKPPGVSADQAREVFLEVHAADREQKNVIYDLISDFIADVAQTEYALGLIGKGQRLRLMEMIPEETMPILALAITSQYCGKLHSDHQGSIIPARMLIDLVTRTMPELAEKMGVGWLLGQLAEMDFIGNRLHAHTKKTNYEGYRLGPRFHFHAALVLGGIEETVSYEDFFAQGNTQGRVETLLTEVSQKLNALMADIRQAEAVLQEASSRRNKLNKTVSGLMGRREEAERQLQMLDRKLEEAMGEYEKAESDREEGKEGVHSAQQALLNLIKLREEEAMTKLSSSPRAVELLTRVL